MQTKFNICFEKRFAYVYIFYMPLYAFICYITFTFARESTGTDGNPKTREGGKIISIPWVLGLQNSSYIMNIYIYTTKNHTSNCAHEFWPSQSSPDHF